MGIFAIVCFLIGVAGFDPKAGVVPGSRTRMPTRRSIFRWPTARSRRWVDAFLDRAAGDPNLLAVIAIGSATRPGVESEDLDLLVICRDRSAIAERPPIEVDLRKVALDRVEPSLRSGNDLLVGAVQFGRPLLDREGHWAAITRRWRHVLPLPDPEVADERAAAARQILIRMQEIGDEEAAAEYRLIWLSHRARASLARAGAFPRSRPELPPQLREHGQAALAASLDVALEARSLPPRERLT